MDGVIYDMTDSKIWGNGTHKGFSAGRNLGHKVMALVSVVLFLAHLFFRNAIYQMFGVF